MNITLIGYRGSGKSSIVPLIAERLNWSWADVDRLIEQQAGKSIKEIFAEDGEPAFRKTERSVVIKLFQNDQIVIGTGGGTVIDLENRKDFMSAGPVIWLKASADELYARISKDPISAETRPSLTDKGGGIEEIKEVLGLREPMYSECATIQIETAGSTFEEIVDEIFRQLPPDISSGEL